MQLTWKTLFMNNLEYSIEAEEAKGLFYNKRFTVYVEGDDDVMFWNILFELTDVDAYIEDVGGSEEIEKKITDILNNHASFIVACDSDHTDFQVDRKEHLQIIRTYGYSIENSMYSTKNIENAIRKLSKRPKKLTKTIESWAKEFSNNLFDLLVYDIANHRYDRGVKVFGDNCQRFLKSKSSIEVCKTKVQAFINSIKNKFTAKEIKETISLLKKSKKDLWYHLKGHFITHGLFNLIQHHVKIISGSKCSISHDTLYALTIDCSQSWNKKVDIKFIVERINKLKSA